VVETVIAGVGFLVVVAAIVGLDDSAQSAAWRRIAAERRALREQRRSDGTDG
jgi:hypothetical protein